MFKKIFLSFAISFLAFIPAMSPAHAATGVANLKSNLTTFGDNTGLGSDADLKTKIASVINIALGFLGMLATIMIIYAGFKWLTAAGNEDQVTKAKETLRNAVIGIAVIFLSFVIVNFTVNQLTDTVGGGGGGDGGGAQTGGTVPDSLTCSCEDGRVLSIPEEVTSSNACINMSGCETVPGEPVCLCNDGRTRRIPEEVTSSNACRAMTGCQVQIIQ